MKATGATGYKRSAGVHVLALAEGLEDPTTSPDVNWIAVTANGGIHLHRGDIIRANATAQQAIDHLRSCPSQRLTPEQRERVFLHLFAAGALVRDVGAAIDTAERIAQGLQSSGNEARLASAFRLLGLGCDDAS